MLMVGCKKYEEDNRRYWKNPIRRIAQEWEIVSYQINSVDSLATRNFISNRIEFTRRLEYNDFHILQADNNIVFTRWGFKDDENQIWVDDSSSDSTYHYNPFLYLVDSTISTDLVNGDWTIKKLTNKEFDIESVHLNNMGEIRIEMERIK